MMDERALRGCESLSGLHFFAQIGGLASIIDLRFWVDLLGYMAKLFAQAGGFNAACFLIRFCFV